MATTTHREKVAKMRPKTRRKPLGGSDRARSIQGEIGTLPDVSKLRRRLGLIQAHFARLLPTSVRTLVTLEARTPPTEAVARRLVELERLTDALSEVIKPDSLGTWLLTPAPAFDGLKPLEVIERGQGDRLWQMIYFLRSGVPS